jgi:glycosyltransferase involved in cell wall biosynthesis
MTDRIRVLHVITRMIVGGAQENTLETVCGLDPAEFETELVCGPQTGPEGSLIEEARRRGAQVRIEPSLVREFSPLRDGLALQRLTRLMRDGRYDIVHTHSSKAGILGRLAAGRARIPGVVHTVHGWPFRPNQPAPLRAFYVALERLAAARTDRFVAVTSRDIDKGVKAGVAGPDRFEVVRSAIDMGRFAGAADTRSRTRDSWGFGPEVEVVGTVTRLSPQKAPLDFVAAAAEIASKRPDVGFVVVGDGPLRSEVERAVRMHGLEWRFRLLGIQRDVPELLSGMDLFLHSSLWEGLPRAIVQAMAAGVPVVTTAVDGSSEIVVDGETGRLVPPGDLSAMARAALASLDDPGGRARCAATARAAVGREFDLPTMLARLAQLYRALAGR